MDWEHAFVIQNISWIQLQESAYLAITAVKSAMENLIQSAPSVEILVAKLYSQQGTNASAIHLIKCIQTDTAKHAQLRVIHVILNHVVLVVDPMQFGMRIESASVSQDTSWTFSTIVFPATQNVRVASETSPINV